MNIESENELQSFSETKTTRRKFFGRLTKAGITAAATASCFAFFR